MAAKTSIIMAGAALLAGLLLSGAAPAPTRPAAPAHLLIANQRTQSILFYDVATKQTKELSVKVGASPASPHEIAVSPDRKLAYVPIYSEAAFGARGNDGSSIAIIDLATQAQTGSIDLGRPVRPHRALFGPDGLLYVTAEVEKKVLVVDVAAKKVVGEIPTGQDNTHMFVISPDGSRIYTTNIPSGTVSVLDTKARTLVTTIKANPNGSIQRIAMTPDGSTLFVQAQGGGGAPGAGRGGPPPAGQIVTIDTKTNTVSGSIALPSVAFTSAVTPDGKYLLASAVNGTPNFLYVIDLATKQVVKTVQTCTFAQTIYMAKSGTKAFITCLNDGKLAIVDIPSWGVELVQLPVGIDGLDEY